MTFTCTQIYNLIIRNTHYNQAIFLLFTILPNHDQFIMTSHTAEDDHLLDEETLVPETQIYSPNTFSQRLVRRLGIRSVVRKVHTATPNNNSDKGWQKPTIHKFKTHEFDGALPWA